MFNFVSNWLRNRRAEKAPILPAQERARAMVDAIKWLNTDMSDAFGEKLEAAVLTKVDLEAALAEAGKRAVEKRA